MPELAGVILVWTAVILLAVDSIGSAIAILGLKKNKRISQITEELQKDFKISGKCTYTPDSEPYAESISGY